MEDLTAASDRLKVEEGGAAGQSLRPLWSEHSQALKSVVRQVSGRCGSGALRGLRMLARDSQTMQDGAFAVKHYEP
ncbi:MAG TPA: hypothetical protein VK358_00640 [Longimicrobium sp.]|nr:hypothetical protein [Longimicrobium sp.]